VEDESDRDHKHYLMLRVLVISVARIFHTAGPLDPEGRRGNQPELTRALACCLRVLRALRVETLSQQPQF
jgi:hypothetical protein